MANEAFKATYVDTSNADDYYSFENAISEFSSSTAEERPWA